MKANNSNAVSELDFSLRVGNLFRAYREELGWSTKEMQNFTHISAGTITRLENGLTDVSLQTIFSLCEGMGLPLDILFKEITGNVVPRFINQDGEVGPITLPILLQTHIDFIRELEFAKGQVCLKANRLFEKTNRQSEPLFKKEMIDLFLFLPKESLNWLSISSTEPHLSKDEVLNLVRNAEVITRSNLDDYLHEISTTKPIIGLKDGLSS